LLPVFLIRPAAEGQRRPNCSDFTDDVAGIRHLITGNSEAIRQGLGSCGDWVIWVEFVRVCLQRLVGVSDSGLWYARFSLRTATGLVRGLQV